MPTSEARVVVLCGLPGVGKTTVGEAIAERVDGRLLRTDVVRQELVEDPTYSEAEIERVYRALFERAVETVRSGESVVLDATFRSRDLRARAREAAERAGVPIQFVRVTCEQSVAVARIRERTDDESDAGVEDYDRFREIFDPLEREHVTVDNSGSLAETREQVTELF